MLLLMKILHYTYIDSTMLRVEGEASIKPTFIKLPDMTADLSGTGGERYSILTKVC